MRYSPTARWPFTGTGTDDDRHIVSGPSPTLNRCQAVADRQNVAVNFRDRIIAWDKLPAWRAAFRATNQRLVVTNGCFDLLHLGHVTYLESARGLGDALLVGVNSDSSVVDLKGPGRPINQEDDRASVVAALESVDGV